MSGFKAIFWKLKVLLNIIWISRWLKIPQVNGSKHIGVATLGQQALASCATVVEGNHDSSCLTPFRSHCGDFRWPRAIINFYRAPWPTAKLPRLQPQFLQGRRDRGCPRGEGELIWSPHIYGHYDKSRPFPWTSLNKFGQVWTSLDKIEQVETRLNTFRLDKNEQVKTWMNTVRQDVTSSNKIEHV